MQDTGFKLDQQIFRRAIVSANIYVVIMAIVGLFLIISNGFNFREYAIGQFLLGLIGLFMILLVIGRLVYRNNFDRYMLRKLYVQGKVAEEFYEYMLNVTETQMYKVQTPENIGHGDDYFNAVWKYDLALIIIGVCGLIVCGSSVTLLLIFGRVLVLEAVLGLGFLIFMGGLGLAARFRKIKTKILDKLFGTGKITATFYFEQKQFLDMGL